MTMTIKEVLDELRDYLIEAEQKQRLSQPGLDTAYWSGRVAAHQSAIRLVEAFLKDNDLEASK